MPVGAQPLWHVNYKINTLQRGLNMKFHIAGGTEAEAKAKALELSTRIRWVMPETAEIFFATLSKDNTKKDSRFLKTALGVGLHPPTLPATTTFPDFPTTSLLIRFEHDDGGEVTRKIGPVPDEVIEDGTLLASITSVDTMPLALPAASGGGDTYAVRMNKLMQVIMLYTDHVMSGHAPGGEYNTFRWSSAFAMRIGQKKGGRIFI